MTDSERAQLAAIVVRELLRSADDLDELDLAGTANALRALTQGVATVYEVRIG